MCDERETSATRRARAGGVRELRPKLSLCAGALVLGAAACLPAFRNAVSPTLPLLPYILGKIGVAGLAGLLYFLILGLSPAHCRLGGSVRAQSPASPKDTTALFADIDADIRDHGQRFGDLSIGREWVLFLDAMRISRIQGIFTAAIPPEREGESGTYSLWLADVDNNLLEAFLPSRKTLEDARAHLLERVPDAFIGGEDDLEFFFAMDGADRREINRRVRARQAAQAAPGPVAFAYAGPDGIPTSLATEAGIEAEFAAHPDGAADLVPLSPLFLPTGEECFSIACEPDGKGRFRFMLFLRRGDDYRRSERSMERAEARTLFLDCFRRGLPPSANGWQETAWERDLPPERQSLLVDEERFDDNTFEDVEAALDGVDAGVYGSFLLMPGDFGYLSLNGKQGRDYIVETAFPAPDGDFEYYRIKTPRRDQVLFWFSAYYEHAQPPYVDGWEDVTKAMRRRRNV